MHTPSRVTTTIPTRRRPCLLTFTVMLLLATCSSSDGQSVERWFDVARSEIETAPPTDDVVQIVPGEPCALVDSIGVDGKQLELFGAATAEFGEVGDRYQCAWSGDTNGSANVRLEVVLVDDADDYQNYAALVPTREGNVVVPTDIGDVQVAEFRPDAGPRPVTTAVLVVPQQRGGVHLVVELLDPDLKWEPQQYAELLEDLAP